MLVLSGDLSELLVLRRIVLATPHSVESARSAAQAFAQLSQQRRGVLVVDEAGLPPGVAVQALAEAAKRWPDMLRVLLARAPGALDARYVRIERRFYALPLRELLVDHGARQATPEGPLDTVRDDSR